MVSFYICEPTMQISFICGTDWVLFQKKNFVSKNALSTIALGKRIINLSLLPFLAATVICEQIMLL
jgi:hypothetical protein